MSSSVLPICLYYLPLLPNLNLMMTFRLILAEAALQDYQNNTILLQQRVTVYIQHVKI